MRSYSASSDCFESTIKGYAEMMSVNVENVEVIKPTNEFPWYKFVVRE